MGTFKVVITNNKYFILSILRTMNESAIPEKIEGKLCFGHVVLRRQFARQAANVGGRAITIRYDIN